MNPECPCWRHVHYGARCARRSLFTHRETLTREPALAPAPGKALRSRESRPSRNCAVDPALGARTQNSVGNQLCWRLFTHREKLTREPALAPAPGTDLRSRESRPNRISVLDPAIGGRKENSIKNQLCWRCGAVSSVFSRRRRTFDESSGERSRK